MTGAEFHLHGASLALLGSVFGLVLLLLPLVGASFMLSGFLKALLKNIKAAIKKLMKASI